MKCKLGVGDRLSLVDVIPNQGDYMTMKTIQELNNKLLPSGDEAKEFNLRTVSALDGKSRSYQWGKLDEKTGELIPEDFKREIEIKDTELKVIVEALKKLDNEKKLHPQHMNLYDMFVVGKKEEKEEEFDEEAGPKLVPEPELELKEKGVEQDGPKD